MTRICRFQWQRRLSRGSAVALLLGLWVRIPLEVWMSVSFDCCVLPLRRADHSYRGILKSVHVSECDRDSSIMKRSWDNRGCCAMEKKWKELYNNLFNVLSKGIYSKRNLPAYELYLIYYLSRAQINNAIWRCFKALKLMLIFISHYLTKQKPIFSMPLQQKFL